MLLRARPKLEHQPTAPSIGTASYMMWTRRLPGMALIKHTGTGQKRATVPSKSRWAHSQLLAYVGVVRQTASRTRR